MSKKRLFINLISSLVAFAVQFGISFFLTPKIVNHLGEEAYGFIGLANNFISYATILTIALNSMASRFISIEFHKNNKEKANEYYSSTFFTNLFVSFIILILSIIMLINLENLLNITPDLIIDVKITFALAFLSFMLTLITNVFNVATFIKNRLDLSSVRNIISNVLRAIILIVLFTLLKPKIYFICIATLICTIYITIANVKLTKQIAPDLKIQLNKFRFSSVKKLLSSGIWNSISTLGRTLLIGLDLLIANLLVSPQAMGLLSIAKTIPTTVESFLTTIANVFTPQFTILYSQNKTDELVKELKFSIKVLSLIMTVPIAGLIVFGTSFFSLWLNSKNMNEIMQIQILSILSLAPYIFSSFIFTLFSIDTVTNQLKRPVVVTLTMSIISTLLTFILLNITNLGIYAIAGVSSFFWTLKILIFNPINAAYNLKIKWNTFYPPFLRAILCLIIIIIIFSLINYYVIINSWLNLIVVAILAGILGYIINYLILLNSLEKKKVKEKLHNFIKINN